MNSHYSVLRDLLKITVRKIDKTIAVTLNTQANKAKIKGSDIASSIVVISKLEKEAYKGAEILKNKLISKFHTYV